MMVQQMNLGHQPMGGNLASMGASMSAPVDVKFKPLPFYDVHDKLIPPTILSTKGSSRFQTSQFQFLLTLQQANDIASNRDMRQTAKISHLYQIQLRFCQMDTSGQEVGDEFPPSIVVEVNNKMCSLPNPIPTNKQGVEPKRPPKPVDITPLCKLSPALSNNITIKWNTDQGKGWVVAIFLVEKLTSNQLYQRMQDRGSREQEFTKDMIQKKLNDEEDDIATTDIKVSLACPLGKMRMAAPCRPSTCDHLQCFDANLFIQMNERKPTWQCPVCYSQALYKDLYLDGYFLDVINSKELPEDENEIILNQDGTWKPIPREEVSEEERKKQEEAEAKFSLGGSSADVECIDID